jgi:hypothetical protein
MSRASNKNMFLSFNGFLFSIFILFVPHTSQHSIWHVISTSRVNGCVQTKNRVPQIKKNREEEGRIYRKMTDWWGRRKRRPFGFKPKWTQDGNPPVANPNCRRHRHTRQGWWTSFLFRYTKEQTHRKFLIIPALPLYDESEKVHHILFLCIISSSVRRQTCA